MTPDALARIHAEAFTQQRPWSAAELRRLLESPGSFLLAHNAGFGLIRVVADEAELLTLAILPRNQRQGLGAALLRGLMTTAASAGADRMFLEVAVDNSPAISLYIKTGFAETARRPDYYRTPDGKRRDAVVMDAILR